MTPTTRRWPSTPEAAVEELLTLLSESDKAALRGLPKGEAPSACHFGLGMDIRNRFGLWAGNEALLRSCMKVWRRQHREKASPLPSRLARLQETARLTYECIATDPTVDPQLREGFRRLAEAGPDELPGLTLDEDRDDGFLFLDADTASSVIVEVLWARLQEGGGARDPMRD